MSTSTIPAPSGQTKADADLEKVQEGKAVARVASELLGKMPTEKFDSRSDVYRAIYVNVIFAVSNAMPDLHDISDRKSAVEKGTSFGMQIFNNVENLCVDYGVKAEGAARLLVLDKDLASEAMSAYLSMRMNAPDASPITPEKRTDYRAVREELLKLSDSARFENALMVEHPTSAESKKVTYSVPLRS